MPASTPLSATSRPSPAPIPLPLAQAASLPRTSRQRRSRSPSSTRIAFHPFPVPLHAEDLGEDRQHPAGALPVDTGHGTVPISARAAAADSLAEVLHFLSHGAPL